MAPVINGVRDSKKITTKQRERLATLLMESPDARYSLVEIDAKRIDEINIRQATLEGMAKAIRNLSLVLSRDVQCISAADSTNRTQTTTETKDSSQFLEHGTENEFGFSSQKNALERTDTTYDSKCTHPAITTTDALSRSTSTVESSQTSLVRSGTESQYVLVDGDTVPDSVLSSHPNRCESVVEGDSKIYTVSAASIIAKVYRDKLMTAFAVKYPPFGLDKHKGYGTAQHIAALREHGVTDIHRMSFRPCRDLHKYVQPAVGALDAYFGSNKLSAVAASSSHTISDTEQTVHSKGVL